MKNVFKRPEALKDVPFHFCAGCHHGIIHRLVGEAIDKFGVQGTRPSGWPRWAARFFYTITFDVDVIESPHGRAAAVSTGVKRAKPDHFRIHLPGRRRSGGHWHGRDHSRGQPGRVRHRFFCQQRGLRHDRRPDGPPRPCWARRPPPRPSAGTWGPGTRSAWPRCWPGWTGPPFQPAWPCTRSSSSSRPKRPSARPSRPSSRAWAWDSSSSCPPVRPTGR